MGGMEYNTGYGRPTVFLRLETGIIQTVEK